MCRIREPDHAVLPTLFDRKRGRVWKRDPEIYAACFRKVRDAIRAVQPNAKVIIGHMVSGDNQRQAIRLLGRDGYDGLTAHTGSSVPDDLLTMLDQENARPGVGVYITEWGWEAGTNRTPAP